MPALVAGLIQPDGGIAAEILWHYRLPRLLFAFLIGALLAMAGALMQTLLRNPLADPYILGTSGGAATGRSCRTRRSWRRSPPGSVTAWCVG